MKGQLIPPPEFAPPSVKHLTLEQRISLWANLLDESEALLLSGLRARIGPEGDLQAAYRDWYARRMDDHDKMQVLRAENMTRRERGDGK